MSQTGTLLYRNEKPFSFTIQWIDGSGKRTPAIGVPGAYDNLALSPDGTRLALTISDGNESNIWNRDLRRGTMTRLTSGKRDTYPMWRPDGKHLLFRGADGIYIVRSDGGDKPNRVLEGPFHSSALSPDGGQLALVRRGEATERDIWLSAVEGNGKDLRVSQPRPFVNTAADELSPAFSPDGNWLAYAGGSNVYVQPVVGSGPRLQASVDSARMPVFAPVTNDLYFMNNNAPGLGLSVVKYSVKGGEFIAESPRPFSLGTTLANNTLAANKYAISSDNRLLAVVPASGGEAGQTRPRFIVMLNFFDEIKRRAAQTVAQ